MKNALAVYTSKSSLNGGKLAGLAEENGLTLRFLALGGYIPSNADEIRKKALTSLPGGSLLVIGAFESDAAAISEFDEFLDQGDRQSLANVLNEGRLPWCELYASRFNYEKTIKKFPKEKPKIDGSVSKDQLPALKSAKTRYIIYNQSRRKNGGELMTHLVELLSSMTDGIIADYQRPSR